jgi:thymidylate kinase
MSGVIVIEGPDGTGKTTLAAAFQRQFNAHVLHADYRWCDKIFYYHTALLRKALKLADTGKLVILDRLWPSELIYGQLYRGGTRFPHLGQLLDRVLLKHAALYIFCNSPADDLARRHAQLRQVRDELYHDKIQQLSASYRAFVRHFNRRGRFDVVEYSIEAYGDKLDDYCQVIVDRLQLWRQLQLPSALNFSTHNVLGHIVAAKFLFVGDRVNPKLRQVRWPFYEHGNCSLFLAACLDSLNFATELGMWTNANDGDEFKEILAFKPELTVIGLGKQAANTLRRAGVKCVELPHPQYGRRFDRQGFKRQLSQVLMSHDV